MTKKVLKNKFYECIPLMYTINPYYAQTTAQLHLSHMLIK